MRPSWRHLWGLALCAALAVMVALAGIAGALSGLIAPRPDVRVCLRVSETTLWVSVDGQPLRPLVRRTCLAWETGS